MQVAGLACVWLPARSICCAVINSILRCIYSSVFHRLLSWRRRCTSQTTGPTCRGWCCRALLTSRRSSASQTCLTRACRPSCWEWWMSATVGACSAASLEGGGGHRIAHGSHEDRQQQLLWVGPRAGSGGCQLQWVHAVQRRLYRGGEGHILEGDKGRETGNWGWKLGSSTDEGFRCACVWAGEVLCTSMF